MYGFLASSYCSSRASKAQAWSSMAPRLASTEKRRNPSSDWTPMVSLCNRIGLYSLTFNKFSIRQWLWIGKFRFRFQFRLRFPFRIQTILSTVFQQQKNWYQILPFQCQKKHYFPESWPLSFDFLPFLIPFYVGSGSKSGSLPAKAKDTVPPVPVPQPWIKYYVQLPSSTVSSFGYWWAPIFWCSLQRQMFAGISIFDTMWLIFIPEAIFSR
jgi:hypothetical protein